MSSSNKNIVLIMGKPNSGKSTSLRNIPNQNEFVYLNTDLKELPFKADFLQNVEVKDAMDILSYIEEIEKEPQAKGAILDTLTFLMSTYERQYVNTSVNTQKHGGIMESFIVISSMQSKLDPKIMQSLLMKILFIMMLS